MTVSAKQNWTSAGTGTNVATQALVLVSIPTAGNLMVCYAERGLGTGTMSVADNIGDSVSWTEINHIANTTEGVTVYGWWKVVGTPSGGLKTVTVTNVTDNRALQVTAAEYQSSVGGITWGLNGTASSNTGLASVNPSPGAITLDANPSVVIGFVSTDNALSTAVATYTRQAIIEAFGEDAVEDKFVAASGSQTPSWTSASSNWCAMGSAFKATPAASGIAFDAAANSSDVAASANYTFSRTVTGSNIYLAVDVELLTVTGATVTSVTDDDGGGNKAMTLIGTRSTVTGAGRVECWGLAGAVTGTKTIRVILSASIESVATAASYTGVNQTEPTETFNSNQATNVGAADATVVITSLSDNCWIHAACVANDTTITANQTSRNNVSGTLGSGANEDNNAAVTPAGATTMSYTNIAALATWAIAGYAIRPIADFGPGARKTLSGIGTRVGVRQLQAWN